MSFINLNRLEAKKMKTWLLVGALTLLVLLVMPISVDGDPLENPDYWCGYICVSTSIGDACETTSSQYDACVWYSWSPWLCLTDEDAQECRPGSGL